MRLRQGYLIANDRDVSRLRSSLYGLKQALQAWFEKILRCFIEAELSSKSA